ncbi:UDP-N-acetylglucosamine 4,6-dehydratase family protein [Massilia sp. TS11]|uniref:UDP-N-acetylglucosamine 4,6-dehydratase family protein n=1 Tax=Massilia sp. TS11 TaxID=2908003 RepID=UPI0035A27C51
MPSLPFPTLLHRLNLSARAPARRTRRRDPYSIPPEALLGRAPVPPDPRLFARCVSARQVLVTGAGGSIGSELCRQIAALNPRALHLLDHSELALYTVRQQLASAFPDLTLHAHLGSVCQGPLVARIFAEAGIDTVYHAAAYKHVALVESNPAEGLRNNVLGAQVVASAAARHGVRTCVLVSSDKAVRPSSVMGASKRISELIFLAAAHQSQTTFSIVRFGNVLESSGSVVPLFRQQLARGGPLTVTDPEVTRYFMLIPEAAQLVIQAGAMAEGGEVFVLDMGEPVRIVDLARRMIALCGLRERTPEQPDGDIAIRFIGLAPGEKLYEELLTANEAVPSSHPRILRAREPQPAVPALEAAIARLLAACDSNEAWRIAQLMRGLVGDFPAFATRSEEVSACVPILRP